MPSRRPKKHSSDRFQESKADEVRNDDLRGRWPQAARRADQDQGDGCSDAGYHGGQAFRGRSWDGGNREDRKGLLFQRSGREGEKSPCGLANGLHELLGVGDESGLEGLEEEERLVGGKMQRLIQPVRLAGQRPPAWRPALAQAVTAATMTPPGAVTVAQKPPFIDSALLSAVFSGLGATASGILAYAASYRKNNLSYLFGIMGGILGFKAIAELNDARER